MLGGKAHNLNHSVIRIADTLLLVYCRISGRFMYIHRQLEFKELNWAEIESLQLWDSPRENVFWLKPPCVLALKALGLALEFLQHEKVNLFLLQYSSLNWRCHTEDVAYFNLTVLLDFNIRSETLNFLIRMSHVALV